MVVAVDTIILSNTIDYTVDVATVYCNICYGLRYIIKNELHQSE